MIKLPSSVSQDMLGFRQSATMTKFSWLRLEMLSEYLSSYGDNNPTKNGLIYFK